MSSPPLLSGARSGSCALPGLLPALRGCRALHQACGMFLNQAVLLHRYQQAGWPALQGPASRGGEVGPPWQREKPAFPGGRALTLAFISILEERPDDAQIPVAPKPITTPVWLELGECSGTRPLFSRVPSFSQEASTSLSAPSWQMQKEEVWGGCKGQCRGRSGSAGPHLCSGLLATSQMFSPVCSEMCIQEENVGWSVDQSILSAPSTPVAVSTNGSLPRQEGGPSCLCLEAQPGEAFSPGLVHLYVGELVKHVPLMTRTRQGGK